MNKVQLTLTAEEADILSAKAAQLGYNLTRYIKFLIGREATEIVEQSEIPTFQMSRKAEEVALKAKEEHKSGKTRKIVSFTELGS